MASRTPALDRIVTALSAHVQLAAADLTLFYALCESIRTNDGLTRCAHDFVWFTVRALRDAGISHLYRLYDTNRTAVSLSKFIRAAAGDSAQRREDLRSVSAANPAVKKLLRLRHEAIGHTSEQVLDLGVDKYVSRYSMTLDDMQDLLKNALRLLEGYSGQQMVIVTPAFNDQAGRDVMDLASYLSDAMPTMRGIERVVREVDGQPRSKGAAV